MPEKQRHPRQGIIDLISCIRSFRPLVNESALDPVLAKNVPMFEALTEKVNFNRDQVLILAIRAIADISKFISAYEDMKERYEHLTADAMLAYAAGKEIEVEAESLQELTESLRGKFRQACDVLETIKQNTTDPDAKATADAYLSRFVIERAKIVRPDFGAADSSPDDAPKDEKKPE